MFDLQNPTFWVGVAFVVFFALVIWKGGFGALGKSLDARAEKIRLEIETAQKLRQDAEAALTAYQKKQRDAMKEADAIIAAAREEADRIRQHAEADLEATLKRREAQALEKIAQAEAAALQQVRSLAVDVALAATESLLTQTIDQSRSDAMVASAIEELPGKLH
ncbi:MULTISPECIES: F0F1 ATP synthase subunit B family protein [Nitrospirillum]|uniref:ATP synthase subunit b n=1 Tax=Nitrospirillum amazonense TaxID=28077 RepID=A0A560FRY8_9PROT|nr:F0F1 ATP synthase subunit B [Nitrospirillum amazonense]MEC4593694.1 F0F1 ATP synthase subunit B [Nitrospirillum amazonense]TWB24343.1 F-type H+-transporting ATPase subunit b [Nitrospirillum amazonense]